MQSFQLETFTTWEENQLKTSYRQAEGTTALQPLLYASKRLLLKGSYRKARREVRRSDESKRLKVHTQQLCTHDLMVYTVHGMCSCGA
jgi:hypothetical protein